MDAVSPPSKAPFSLTQRLDEALKQPKLVRVLKLMLFVACLWPMVEPPLHLYLDPLALGANPAEHIIRDWGDWALQLLLLTLLIRHHGDRTGLSDVFYLGNNVHVSNTPFLHRRIGSLGRF